MTVAKLVPVLEAAMAGGYGVLAVNIVNGLTLKAVVDAAEELRAPVIVQTSVKTVLSQGIPETMSMYRHAAGLQNRCANRPTPGGSGPRAWPRLKSPSCGAWRNRDRDAGV
jgi:hypothetical protein